MSNIDLLSAEPLTSKAHKREQQEMNLSHPAPKPQPSEDQITLIIRFFAAILAIRLFLLLSLIGGFVLSWYAMQAQTNESLIVFIAYALLMIFPLVYLELKGKSSGG